MTAAPRIACMGECMLELTQGPGGETRFGFGGDTLNTAVYMARRLGPGQVSYVTALGTDPYSEEMIAAWQKDGIDCALVYRLENALPGLYLIKTAADGERSFYYWREQAAVRSLLDAGRDIELVDHLRSFDLLYLSGITLALFRGERRERLFDCLARCAQAGVQLALDTNYRPRLWESPEEARACMTRAARLSRFVLPSYDDDVALFGPADEAACLERWCSLGVAEVVLKTGAGPCAIALGGERFTEVADVQSAPRDTTAAGDAFGAAYLSARLRGSAPSEAAREAHALAARVIMHPGAIIPADA